MYIPQLHVKSILCYTLYNNLPTQCLSFSGESSTFNASMMTSVDPGTVAAGVPSVMSMASKQEDIDPTKPNENPILKVYNIIIVEPSRVEYHKRCMIKFCEYVVTRCYNIFVVIDYWWHILTLLQLESLKDSLRTAERAVIQNVYQQKQALYRKEPVLKGCYCKVVATSIPEIIKFGGWAPNCHCRK